MVAATVGGVVTSEMAVEVAATVGGVATYIILSVISVSLERSADGSADVSTMFTLTGRLWKKGL